MFIQHVEYRTSDKKDHLFDGWQRQTMEASKTLIKIKNNLIVLSNTTCVLFILNLKYYIIKLVILCSSQYYL